MATNAVYQKLGTTVSIGSEGGDDVDWTTESVGDGAGRQSDQQDLGILTTARSNRFHVLFYTQIQATPTAGQAVHLYAKSADTTSAATAHALNDDGLSDAAVSAEDKLRNLIYVGSAVSDEAAGDIEIAFEGEVTLSRRYVQWVLWNDTGAAITADAAETKAEITPIFDDIQASA